jgi:glycine betaine/proline transport system ATP-binding protein
VKAHSVMMPVAEYMRSQPTIDVGSLLRTTTEADIGALIELTMQSNRDAVAVIEGGKVVGVVTTRGLLCGVAGSPAAVPVAA